VNNLCSKSSSARPFYSASCFSTKLPCNNNAARQKNKERKQRKTTDQVGEQQLHNVATNGHAHDQQTPENIEKKARKTAATCYHKEGYNK
jgi:hypothetical protein